MHSLFNAEGPMFRILSFLVDLVIISLFFMVCCIPVVTIGGACIALYDVAAHYFRDGEGHMLGRFFRTLKNEFLRGLLLELIVGLSLYVFGFWSAWLLRLGMESAVLAVISRLLLVTLLLPPAFGFWCFCLESRFVYPFGVLLKNGFLFVFLHLPQTAAAMVILVLAFVLLWAFPSLIIVLPGLTAYLQSFFAEKVLKQYMPKEPAE